MNQLVSIKDGKALTNSLLIAQKFDKMHKHILTSIREFFTAENPSVKNMFTESSYINERGQSQPMFIMNRDGFSLLVMGFTGKAALEFKLEFINAFNQMEIELSRPKELTRKDLAMMIVEAELELEKERAEALAKQKSIQDEANKKAVEEKAKQDAKLKAEQDAKAKIEAELQAKKDAETRAENERLAKIEAEKKAAALATKAPIKKQLSIWVESFELPAFATKDETAILIHEKFEAFKLWSQTQIKNL